MNLRLPLAYSLAFLLFSLVRLAGADTTPAVVPPAEIAKRVASGKAVLVDVREPAEWAEGVAAPASLLPLSDLRGDRKLWTDFLKAHAGKEIILYCRSGNRARQAGEILSAEGVSTANGGSFQAWKEAGEPVRKPAEPAKP